MRINFAILILLSQASFVSAEVTSDTQKIESEASHYRMLAIECITDKKITKNESLKIESCMTFKKFVHSKYPTLKTSLEQAQQQIKVEAKTEGLASDKIRHNLILLMSARSHMKVAAEISTQI